MVSIIISEINGWNEIYCRRTLIGLMVATTLCGTFFILSPQWCFGILTGYFIWIGLAAGKQSWSEIKIDGWMIQGKQDPIWILAGKISAILIITLIHFVILLPLLIFTSFIWGIPWSILGEILIGFWITTGLMATLGMLGTLSFGEEISEFPRKLFSFIFLVATCIPGLQICNPVFQIINIIKGNSGGMLQFIPNLLLIILALFIVQFFCPREVKESE